MLCLLQVDHWLEFSARRLCGQSDLSSALADLDKALALRTFLVGHSVTLADLCIWAALKGQSFGWEKYIYIHVLLFTLLVLDPKSSQLNICDNSRKEITSRRSSQAPIRICAAGFRSWALRCHSALWAVNGPARWPPAKPLWVCYQPRDMFLDFWQTTTIVSVLLNKTKIK